eukprot:s2900_g8.t1
MSGKPRFGPSQIPGRFWWDTYERRLQNTCAKAPNFIRYSFTISCGVCPCSPEASLCALAAGHAQREPMSSLILVQGMKSSSVIVVLNKCGSVSLRILSIVFLPLRRDRSP